jgi:hypothetical protein
MRCITQVCLPLPSIIHRCHFHQAMRWTDLHSALTLMNLQVSYTAHRIKHTFASVLHIAGIPEFDPRSLFLSCVLCCLSLDRCAALGAAELVTFLCKTLGGRWTVLCCCVLQCTVLCCVALHCNTALIVEMDSILSHCYRCDTCTDIYRTLSCA